MYSKAQRHHAKRRRTWAAASRGMTLVEILVVLAIISLIVGGVGVMALSRLDKAKLDTAYNETVEIEGIVEQFTIQKNRCPKDFQDLKTNGFARKVKKDPWTNDYELKCPGQDGRRVDVSSAGPDGDMGTDDDIHNYEPRPGSDEDGKDGS